MTDPSLIDVMELLAITEATAATGTIDPTKYLENDKVFIFSGALDSVVDPGVARKLTQYYTILLNGPKASLVPEYSIPAEHAMVGAWGGSNAWSRDCHTTSLVQVTDDFGSKCDVFGSPYINNCNYSAAYHILQQIYRDLLPANSSSAKLENVREASVIPQMLV